MKTIIIEDEYPAAERLQRLIQKIDPSVEVLAVLDSVEAASKWFSSNKAPDLVFSDIQLSDGLSFEIFRQNIVSSPIIFTTSYDEYAIQAFKVKSIDYLLKPIKSDELKDAIAKYIAIKNDFSHAERALQMESFIDSLSVSVGGRVGKKYKKRFLVKSGEQLVPVSEEEIAFFMSTNELVLLAKTDGKKFLVDYTLEQLERLLHPELFFRINRQFIAHLQGIHKIHTYFNGKLKLQLIPEVNEEVMVSREKVPPFKRWLEGQETES
ncbi:MAG: LytTR family DNA-binding domain-containing protein [Bacteroidota bacterium]